MCYRPNFKPWKDHSKENNKQEILQAHPENLGLLVLRGMKLVAFLQKNLFGKNLREG